MIKNKLEIDPNAPPDNMPDLSLSKTPLINQFEANATLDKENDEITDMCNDLFPPDDKEPKLVQKAKLIKDCTILKYGIKPSNEVIEYTFCKTCDINLIYPICIPCIEECHRGHNIKRNYLKGHIKCMCGEKLHTFDQVNKKDETISCLFSEWSVKSKLNVYYMTKFNKPLCIFCHNFCNDKKEDRIIHETDGNKIPMCSCQNEKIHSEYKILYEKLNKITNERFDILSTLHPISILNLIFKSEKSFSEVYSNFVETMRALSSSSIVTQMYQLLYLTSTNFTATNCYQSLKNFTSISECNKHTGLRYFCEEIEKYFSFDAIKKVFPPEHIESSNNSVDNVSIWSFRQKVFYLFHKIYIGNHTQPMDKYKLYDLENISCLQRYAIFHTNTDIFPQSSDIVAFLLEKLTAFNLVSFSHLEAYNAVAEICAVLKRLSAFSLISNGDMIRICMEIEKFFPTFSILRKSNIKNENNNILWEKETKLFYIIIKMLHYFIYSFNDRLIKNIVLNKKKYPTLDSINFDTTQFIFDKTDIGRLISRLSIRIMSILQRFYSEREESDIYINIMDHGMKILSYFLYNYDSYLLSLNKSKQNESFYLKLIEMDENSSSVYKTVKEEQKKIEKAYISFFNFNSGEGDLIAIVDKSLTVVDGVESNSNKNLFTEMQLQSILKSNYFNTLSKIFEIVHFPSQLSIKHKEFIEKIINFYQKFIRSSSDNAMLVLSHYIFLALIKNPIEYASSLYDIFYECIELIQKNESVIPCSFHILNNLYEYLKDLHKRKLNSINDILLKFLSIMEMLVMKIKCLNVEMVILHAKKILTDINKDFDIVNSFLLLIENDENEELDMTKEKNAMIFLIFITLVNNVFNFADETERKTTSMIIPIDKMISCLQNHRLSLPLRSQVIKYLRKSLIDLVYDDKNDTSYANAIINCDDKLGAIKTNPLISNFQYPTKLLTFKKDLLMISKLNKTKTKSLFDTKAFSVLMYELTNIKSFIEKIKSSNNSDDIYSMQYYFENAIIIPSVCFLRKCFCVIHTFTGEEVLNVYDLIANLLNAKLMIIQTRKNFWEENEEEDESENKNKYNIKGYNEQCSMINGEFLRNDSLKAKTESDYHKIQTKRFSPYDYTALYQIVNEHFYSMIKDTPLTNTAEDFDCGSGINSIKGIKKEESENYNINNKNDIERRLIRAYLLYKNRKESISDDNSCLFSCLHEICLEFETNFRNLLISLLIYNGKKLNNIEIYARASYFLLFKLLSLQTTETQSDVISLLGGAESEKLGFINEFSTHLFKRIMMLFIDNSNPQDKCMNVDYIISYNLIKIFKFLCEEHNNFFQGRLIKGVMYKYAKTLNDATSPIKTIEKTLDDFDKENDNTKMIKFFDFMLHCLTKIILLSKWEHIERKDEQCTNEYLYDLFAAILELLIEIIQGNKPEFLSKIGNAEINDKSDSLIDIDTSESNDSLIEAAQNDSFQKFVENISDMLFRDDVDNELVYQIRNQLMQFFIAILEEKNCNEKMQKFIIKHLNLNKVISSISTVMKSYYIQKQGGDDDNSGIEGKISINNYKTGYGVTKFEDNYTKMDNETNRKRKMSALSIYNNDNSIKNNTIKNNNAFAALAAKARISAMKFNHELYNYFTDEYFQSSDFSKSNEFQLANIFYRYIKLISVQNKSDEATGLINKVTKISEKDALKRFNSFSKESNSIKSSHKSIAPINLINENVTNFDSAFIEKFYIIKFFESITETVEVRTGDSSSINQTVIFTVLPEMIYLSEGTKIEFVNNVNRDSETTKKNDLVRHIEYFQKEIKYYQKRQGFLTKFFSRIDFTYIQIFVYLYALALNLFMLFTLSGDTRMTPIEEDERRRLRMLSVDRNKRDLGSKEVDALITSIINESIDEWAEYYNIITYIFVVINGFFISLWIVFRMPLYYRLDKIKYMETHKITDKTQLTTLNKIRIALYDTIYVRDYITTLIYLFIVSLIGAILTRGEIAYPFLLLAIVNLNPTLKNIVLGIKLKYLELILTFLLAFIIMFVYSNLGFYFFNDNFNDTMGGHEDNYCASLVFCFMSTLDYGLRNRGGVGDLMTRISFKRNTGRYMGRFFYDVTFFLLIVIIMIDMVFGIIIESFQELCNEDQKHENDKKSHCFICHVNRATVEKNRHNFNEHREKTHNLWNYVNYMISLKFADLHDLNAINSYAREKMDNKNISWLPTYKDEGKNDGSSKKRDDNEDNFKVEDENIKKHIVKEA